MIREITVANSNYPKNKEIYYSFYAEIPDDRIHDEELLEDIVREYSKEKQETSIESPFIFPPII